MLTLNNIEVIYSDVILVLKGVSLSVEEGNIVALLGANGAGKSTALKAMSGLLKTELGEVTDGSIEFEGTKIDRKSPEEIVKMGIVQVMEGRPLFEQLTVEENIKVELSSCLKRDNVNLDKKKLIKKDKMKELLGHSPDYLDMLLMGMYWELFGGKMDLR